ERAQDQSRQYEHGAKGEWRSRKPIIHLISSLTVAQSSGCTSGVHVIHGRLIGTTDHTVPHSNSHRSNTGDLPNFTGLPASLQMRKELTRGLLQTRIRMVMLCAALLGVMA